MLPGILLARQQTSPRPGVLANRSNTKRPASKEQPKRLLGVLPNFSAISAGAHPTPPSHSEAFKIATENSFDYSAFVLTGLTSGIAQAEGEHPNIGTGLPGYWGYYWRGFLDRTDGNYVVLFAMPVIFHQDERYYAMGSGSIWKRALYAATRVFFTPDYQGRSTVNISELLGRGLAEGISTAYYPSQDRTARSVGTRFGYAIMRDSLTNVFREFWPDIATHVLHRHL